VQLNVALAAIFLPTVKQFLW